jgi:hypothetical protein
MRSQLLVVAMLATGCLGGERDIEIVFRVNDTTGAPRPEAVTTCGGTCEDDEWGCGVRGTVTDLGDGDRLCTVSDAAAEVWVEASIEHAHVEIYVAAESSDRTVVLWTPTVTAEEVGDDLVIAWSPSPQTPASGAGGRITARVAPAIAELSLGLDATSLTLPREDLEDFDAQVSFEVEQRIGRTTHEHWISSLDVAHTPLVPASRGAACTLTYQVTEGGAPRVETLTFEAGACPLTDGVTDAFDCEGTCSDFVGVVDLGAEQLVRRVRVRSSAEQVAVSTDGVAFTSHPEGAVLDPPVSARYVRVQGERLAEVSVFAP